MGSGIRLNEILDRLYMPTQRIKAACYLQEDIEQQIYTSKKMIENTHDDRFVRQLTEKTFEEARVYTFMIGEFVHQAKEEISSLLQDLQATSDNEFEERFPTWKEG